MTVPQIELRRWPRYPCLQGTESRLIAGVGEHAATVRNISRGGISVAVPKPIDPEEVLTVRLYNRAWNFFLQLPFRVVYTLNRLSGDTVVGGTFTRPLSEREVQE